MSDSTSFYAEHGRITNPGKYREMLCGLPKDPPLLCECIQGVLIHPWMPKGKAHRIPRNRFRDMEIRLVESMLARLQELEDRSLDEARPLKTRFVANCRDFAVLLCAVLREQHVPARVRYGFSTYFAKNFLTDHVICEYWRTDEKRWVAVDSQIDIHHQTAYMIAFDTCDLPIGSFLLAGQAWNAYRNGLLNPNLIGLDVSLKGHRGESFPRSALVRDLAGLNKLELLCIDSWGLADKEQLNRTELDILDRVAALTTEESDDIRKLRVHFESIPGLSVPPTIG
jgi:hypothetical protein